MAGVEVEISEPWSLQVSAQLDAKCSQDPIFCQQVVETLIHKISLVQVAGFFSLQNRTRQKVAKLVNFHRGAS